MPTIYKICPASVWREVERTGTFRGSEADIRDGFIHFSTVEQLTETAAKHFAGERDLVLVRVESTASASGSNGSPRVAAPCFHIFTATSISRR